MNLRTWLDFIVGGRGAMARVSAERWALPIGLLLIVSAGVARRYHTHDLTHEPWRALGGLLIAPAEALLFYRMVYWLGDGEGPLPRFWSGYRAFFGCFALMAPIGWLYGVPWERWLTARGTVAAGLCTTLMAAAWRTALLTRIMTVLFGVTGGWKRMVWPVMLCLDVEVIVWLWTMPRPLVDWRGGLQQTPEDRLMANAVVLAWWAAVATLPVWVVGVRAIWREFEPLWSEPTAAAEMGRPPWAAVGMAGGCVAVWVAVGMLGPFQSEQRLRWRAERSLRSGRVAAALAEMSEHERGEYPPVWDEPPRLGYMETRPGLPEVRAAIEAGAPAEWVMQMYLRKVEQGLKRALWLPRTIERWSEVAETVAQFDARGAVRREPESRAAALFLLAHDRSLATEDRRGLERIAEILGGK